MSDQATPIDEALLEEVRLSLVPGVGPLIRQALLDCFGSAKEVFAAPPSDLRSVSGVGPKLCRDLAGARESIDAEAEIRRCRMNGVRLITRGAPEYPRLLTEIHDPPGVLYLRGNLLEQDALSIAIVGTRHATHYGKQTAERLASGLARAGLTVVSGLARGIDAAAHRGALEGAGRTLAVLGGGVLNVYPPEHGELARRVTEQGALLSEAPPTLPPLKGAFPQRNRIITGLSLGLIVVEAPLRSGALISARLAMEQNREVFAVPGRVDSRASQGCHRLLRDGAHLVETPDDVLEALGPLAQNAADAGGREVRHPAELMLNEQERAVLEAIDTSPTSIDNVIAGSGLPVHRVLATVSVLETRRLIRRLSGQTVVRV